jgi:hypothetical protein
LDRRLAGPQSRSGRDGEEKNSQPLPGLKLPIIQPVTQHYTTEPSRLLLFMYLQLLNLIIKITNSSFETSIRM